jgi:CubicO group peptidase (beta-lactamase class C family)
VILEGGRLAVNEAFGCKPDAAGDVFAVQKGLFALLLGLAREEGVLDVDDPLSKHLPAGWTRLPEADEARLTVRHVLTMTTGMDDALEPEGEVGRTWRYNNAAYNYLKRILVGRTGRDLQSLTRTWLLDPLGMRHTRWVDRDGVLPDGRRISGLETSALDLARLGLLVLADGRWGGASLLPDPAYRRGMLAPGSDANPAWCWLWWRNDQQRFMVPFRDRVYEGVPIPEAPRDAVMAQGAGDNRLYVLPSAGRVVVRRGRRAFAPGERRSFDRELWNHLVEIWRRSG